MAARPDMWTQVARHFDSPTFQPEIWPWIKPLPRETLPDYAKRWSTLHSSSRLFENTIIVGASFGGIVGHEVADALNANTLILVGSARTRSDLPIFIRTLTPLRPIIPYLPWRILQHLLSITRPLWHPIPSQDLTFVTDEFLTADPTLIAWSIFQLLTWKSPTPNSTQTLRIHGSHDHLIPLSKSQADHIIPNSGHVLSISHPDRLAKIIRPPEKSPPPTSNSPDLI